MLTSCGVVVYHPHLLNYAAEREERGGNHIKPLAGNHKGAQIRRACVLCWGSTSIWIYLGEPFVSVLWLPGVIQLSEQPGELQLQNLGVHADDRNRLQETPPRWMT
jgi:hypothetical protein